MVAQPIEQEVNEVKQARRRVPRVRAGAELVGDVTHPSAYEVESFIKDLGEIARRIATKNGVASK